MMKGRAVPDRVWTLAIILIGCGWRVYHAHYLIGLLIIAFYGFALAQPHRRRLVRRLLLVDLGLAV